MCVLAFAWRRHPALPVVIVGNRDEFHDRPTAPADWWSGHPEVLAGRDLLGGGTWMGLSKRGRFAVVTNIREQAVVGPERPRSRGALVRDFLISGLSPAEWTTTVDPDLYQGFNLLYGDLDDARYLSNRDSRRESLDPGVYGLSNHLLDTPWPKLVRTRDRISRCLESDAVPVPEMFDALADRQTVPDDELPATGVPREWERRLSAVFIAGDEYGTRASTVITINAGGTATLEERGFGAAGLPLEVRRFEFSISRRP